MEDVTNYIIFIVYGVKFEIDKPTECIQQVVDNQQQNKRGEYPDLQKQMQQYEQFWHNKLSHLDSQLQLDFDTFIHVFANQIRSQTSIQLNDLQKLIIKQQVDPQNQNQVYKSGYLLFVKNFWGIASQRTKFFNMKVNLTKLKGKTDPLPMIGEIKIKVSYFPPTDSAGQLTSQQKIIDQYLIKDDKISLTSAPHQYLIRAPQKMQQLQTKGFIKIGSSEQNSIVIASDEVNREHIKIIYSTNLQQLGKSTASFIVKPIPINKVYIRDTSSSNKLAYVIDNQNKYIIVKPGMLITGFSFIFDLFQMYVEGVASVEPQQINALIQGLNANRKSFFIGQPDKPQKVAVNFNLQPLNQASIIDLFQRGLYYPPQLPQKPSTSQQMPTQNDKQKTKPTLKLRLLNKRTHEEVKFDSKNSKLIIVGRDAQRCNFVIDHISIRPVEFGFQCINDIWILRSRQGLKGKIVIDQNQSVSKFGLSGVAVFLGKDQSRCSNRQILGTVYVEKFRIKKNVEIEVMIVDREKQQEEDY